MARAAIEAMRDQPMEWSGYHIFGDGPYAITREAAMEIWRGIINEALK